MSGHPDYPYRHEAVEDAVALCKSMQPSDRPTYAPTPAVELFDVLEVASFLLGERDREVERASVDVDSLWAKLPQSDTP